ncbi:MULTISPECIES: hypothetical protein [Psychrobacter]|uniref:hypothetical protein n=1 Tax=Psychrobacter TaxID=497 RepID=UPI000C345DBF|nr:MULTISPECIES: hypothetical protein [Psychrobacter]MBA6244532.1 hypothetical protein [Psychrobacter sp. Urea-trap-18]MBA6285531.1 hypothetical protein [Psychrobacter sp. Urea-trap-16]MBA6317780.1 hypothetical protein [Psychrobacter sp. Urea-trap-20]MBA6334485.1 hypothetical protein [Psychrobacter sp. Urea-trap-19]PKG60639.1 hypothetical protein CXF63_06445 [Psychrobacter sp. Choline-3u-12]
MMKFREKWFRALCLAILVHVGVFFIFYLNTHQTDSVEVAESQTNSTEPIAINNVDLPEKVYTTTVTNTKTSNDTNNNVEDTVNKKSEIGNEPETSQLTSSDEQTANVESRKAPSSPAANNVDNKPEKPASTSKEPAQANKTPPQNEKMPNAQIDSNTQSIVANTDDKLEEIKNNASLLDIDVPAQRSNVKIDKDYLSAKSEVEAINDQLSAVINEVKKRNQQKIDEQQQLRNEANSQRLPENSN